jgi:hypothetical protein
MTVTINLHQIEVFDLHAPFSGNYPLQKYEKITVMVMLYCSILLHCVHLFFNVFSVLRAWATSTHCGIQWNLYLSFPDNSFSRIRRSISMVPEWMLFQLRLPHLLFYQTHCFFFRPPTKTMNRGFTVKVFKSLKFYLILRENFKPRLKLHGENREEYCNGTFWRYL